jgi:glutathione S-transferase
MQTLRPSSRARRSSVAFGLLSQRRSIGRARKRWHTLYSSAGSFHRGMTWFPRSTLPLRRAAQRKRPVRSCSRCLIQTFPSKPPPNKRLKLTGHRSPLSTVVLLGNETKRVQLAGHRAGSLAASRWAARRALARLPSSSMASITLWGRRSAFNVQKVLWALGELRLDFDHRNAGGPFGGLDELSFLAMNPHGRVPVLVDRDVTIWESHSILRYLGARYGPTEIWPRLPSTRSLADRWMDWSLATLQPDFMRLFWSYFRTPERSRDRQVIDQALQACDRHFRLIDAHLQSQAFLAGPEFTLGDIPAGTSLYRYFEMGLEVPRHPHVTKWYGRLSAKSAYQEHVMVPFDELRGRLEF